MPYLVLQIAAVKDSKLRKSNPARFWGLYTVLTFIIQHFLPFALLSYETVRVYLGSAIAGFDSTALHGDRVHHYITEIYVAVKRRTTKMLAGACGRLLGAFSVQVDLWTSRNPGDKYIGACSRWSNVEGFGSDGHMLIRVY